MYTFQANITFLTFQLLMLWCLLLYGLREIDETDITVFFLPPQKDREEALFLICQFFIKIAYI